MLRKLGLFLLAIGLSKLGYCLIKGLEVNASIEVDTEGEE